jgi:hypothetical protein
MGQPVCLITSRIHLVLPTISSTCKAAESGGNDGNSNKFRVRAHRPKP